LKLLEIANVLGFFIFPRQALTRINFGFPANPGILDRVDVSSSILKDDSSESVELSLVDHGTL
jgi:hypothetical protein